MNNAKVAPIRRESKPTIMLAISGNKGMEVIMICTRSILLAVKYLA